MAKYGTLPVGGYKTRASSLPEDKEALDARDTQTIIADNGGAAGMAECYAQAHKGDAIVYAQYNADNTYVNSHTRMLAADPVIIRDVNNAIDLKKSYVLIHEQGDGLYDDQVSMRGKGVKDSQGNSCDNYDMKPSSWRINYKYTLNVLLTREGYETEDFKYKLGFAKSPGTGWGYVPVTMQGFTSGATDKVPYYTEYNNPGTDRHHPIILPNTGWYYSNYWTISGTMIITDANNVEVYNQTKFLLDRSASTGFSTIKLEDDFPDADDNLVEGQTYRITLSFRASNGKTTEVLKNKEFTYTPVTDTTTP